MIWLLILFVCANAFQALNNISFRNSCVVSVVIGSKFTSHNKAIIKNKQNYCRHMGFACYIYSRTLLTERRPLAWQKVHAIDAVLHKKECSRLIWLDADAIIIHPKNIPHTNRDIALTRDLNGINTGVMIIKNTIWSDAFFHRVASTTIYDYHPWWEQAAITHFIQSETETRQHIEFLPLRDYNSYDLNDAPFIYHTAGCSSDPGGCTSKWKNALRLARKNALRLAQEKK